MVPWTCDVHCYLAAPSWTIEHHLEHHHPCPVACRSLLLEWLPYCKFNKSSLPSRLYSYSTSITSTSILTFQWGSKPWTYFWVSFLFHIPHIYSSKSPTSLWILALLYFLQITTCLFQFHCQHPCSGLFSHLGYLKTFPLSSLSPTSLPLIQSRYLGQINLPNFSSKSHHFSVKYLQ